MILNFFSIPLPTFTDLLLETYLPRLQNTRDDEGRVRVDVRLDVFADTQHWHATTLTSLENYIGKESQTKLNGPG